jgi:hypothetical protein
MSHTHQNNPEQQKNKPKHTVHDPVAAAEQISLHPNGRQRWIACFDTVAGQIKTSLDEANQIVAQGGSGQDVVKVFQDTYDAYQRDRDQVIDKLDRVVTQ